MIRTGGGMTGDIVTETRRAILETSWSGTEGIGETRVKTGVEIAVEIEVEIVINTGTEAETEAIR